MVKPLQLQELWLQEGTDAQPCVAARMRAPPDYHHYNHHYNHHHNHHYNHDYNHHNHHHHHTQRWLMCHQLGPADARVWLFQIRDTLVSHHLRPGIHWCLIISDQGYTGVSSSQTRDTLVSHHLRPGINRFLIT
ncbi:hypothetical protein FHG87_001941 [Trinorchestia longiramus]|nr:hypothetical protein FHG87_001941 [Trinorchestia longiramus]